MRLIEERDHPKSCCEKHLKEWRNSPKRQELIKDIEKSISEFEAKIQYEKDWLAKNSNFDDKLMECCQCSRGFRLSEVY
jgi:hypothetical protein